MPFEIYTFFVIDIIYDIFFLFLSSHFCLFVYRFYDYNVICKHSFYTFYIQNVALHKILDKYRCYRKLNSNRCTLLQYIIVQGKLG